MKKVKLKKYGVRFSGHGSYYIPETPLFNKTLKQAKAEALDWEMISDTIGGRAIVVDRSGKNYWY